MPLNLVSSMDGLNYKYSAMGPKSLFSRFHANTNIIEADRKNKFAV